MLHGILRSGRMALWIGLTSAACAATWPAIGFGQPAEGPALAPAPLPEELLSGPALTTAGEDGASAAGGADRSGNPADLPPPQRQPDVVSATPETGTGDLKKSVAGAYSEVFYDNNFDYLNNPNYTDWHLGENLKRRTIGDWATLDLGGQYRARYHSEHNMRGLGLTGRDDDFLLHRTRLYSNLEIGESFRVYAEMLDAVSNYEFYDPRATEENRADLQNLFGDARLYDGDNGDLWARVGRQELIYGAQRTVSPLEWANTRRTFEGYKVFWEGKELDADAFWVRPMRVEANDFDNPNLDQEFMGFYTTYKGLKNKTVDVYYLRYLNAVEDFEFDTLGSRLAGERAAWLYELEGAVQWGDYQGADHNAGFWTAGLGRKFQSLPWAPTLWGYYDWASGSEITGNGYHHLFPLSHKYLGYMDLFGRRNIEDFNFLLTLSPTERLKLLAWWHIFYLQDGGDVPYTVVMTPYNPGVEPRSQYLGQELDLTASWQFTPRQNVLLGYSHFFSGSYFEETPGVDHDGDADFVYAQYMVNF